MATIAKFYLHDAATTNTGTMPSGVFDPGSLAGISDTSGDATGARTARATSDVIGSSQVAATITSTANQTLQSWGYRRFVSPPLAAQTLKNSDGNWTFSYARSESNTNHNQTVQLICYGWRPSTGAVVGTRPLTIVGTEPASTSEAAEAVTGSGWLGGDLVLSDGDILVFEIVDSFTQGMSTAYTSSFFYDGTTEASATSCASFIAPPSALTLAPTGSVITKTQSATARVQITGTKTQSALARIQGIITKTQSAVSRVQITGTKTQAAIARIKNTAVVKTQTAVARIQASSTKTQPSTARIQVAGTKTQSSIARVQIAGTKVQSAVARIRNTAVTKAQSAVARVQAPGTKTQAAVARIQRAGSFTQAATARVTATVAKPQTALARIQKSQVVIQTAAARVQVVATKVQTATASIATAAAVTKTQTAVGRIQITTTRTQPGKARIQKIATFAQTATASVAGGVVPPATDINVQQPPYGSLWAHPY